MNGSRVRRTTRGRYGGAAALGVAVAQPFSLASADRAARPTTGAQGTFASGPMSRLVAAPGGGTWLVTSQVQGYGFGGARTYVFGIEVNGTTSESFELNVSYALN
jgi:hypothetical protein